VIPNLYYCKLLSCWYYFKVIPPCYTFENNVYGSNTTMVLLSKTMSLKVSPICYYFKVILFDLEFETKVSGTSDSTSESSPSGGVGGIGFHLGLGTKAFIFFSGGCAPSTFLGDSSSSAHEAPFRERRSSRSSDDSALQSSSEATSWSSSAAHRSRFCAGRPSVPQEERHGGRCVLPDV